MTKLNRLPFRLASVVLLSTITTIVLWKQFASKSKSIEFESNLDGESHDSSSFLKANAWHPNSHSSLWKRAAPFASKTSTSGVPFGSLFRSCFGAQCSRSKPSTKSNKNPYSFSPPTATSSSSASTHTTLFTPDRPSNVKTQPREKCTGTQCSLSPGHKSTVDVADSPIEGAAIHSSSSQSTTPHSPVIESSTLGSSENAATPSTSRITLAHHLKIKLPSIAEHEGEWSSGTPDRSQSTFDEIQPYHSNGENPSNKFESHSSRDDHRDINHAKKRLAHSDNGKSFLERSSHQTALPRFEEKKTKTSMNKHPLTSSLFRKHGKHVTDRVSSTSARTPTPDAKKLSLFGRVKKFVRKTTSTSNPTYSSTSPRMSAAERETGWSPFNQNHGEWVEDFRPSNKVESSRYDQDSQSDEEMPRMSEREKSKLKAEEDREIQWHTSHQSHGQRVEDFRPSNEVEDHRDNRELQRYFRQNPEWQKADENANEAAYGSHPRLRWHENDGKTQFQLFEELARKREMLEQHLKEEFERRKLRMREEVPKNHMNKDHLGRADSQSRWVQPAQKEQMKLSRAGNSSKGERRGNVAPLKQRPTPSSDRT